MSKSKREQFAVLYLARKYTLEEIAEKLGAAISTVKNWRRKDFPNGAAWRYQLFCRLEESGKFADSEISYLLRVHNYTVARYRRRFEAEKRGEKVENW